MIVNNGIHQLLISELGRGNTVIDGTTVGERRAIFTTAERDYLYGRKVASRVGGGIALRGNALAAFICVAAVRGVFGFVKGRVDYVVNASGANQSQTDAIVSINQFFSSTSERVMCITGGPGTGKSWIIKRIVEACGPDIEVVCPTNRAVSVLRDRGVGAETIHSAYKVSPFQNNPNSDRKSRTQVVIVEESSMVDEILAGSLMSACSYTTKIIFVGDKNQLAPVGAGSPFKDLASSKSIRVFNLSTPMRSKDDRINEAVDLIGKGDINFLKNVKFFEAPDDVCAAKMVSIWSSPFADDLMVMSPVKSEKFGTSVVTANREISKAKGNNFYVTPSLAVRDLVVFKTNCLQAMKGDRGVVESLRVHNDYDYCLTISGSFGIVSVSSYMFEELYIKNFDDLVMRGWCTTVHSSQGGEANNVLLAVTSDTAFSLTRNMLYTAVSRARENVFVVGSSDAIKKGLGRQESRKSALTFAMSMSDDDIKIALGYEEAPF
jgi:exodeoxyribonuclease V alpha subunit